MHSGAQHYAAKHQAARHTTLATSSSVQSLGLLHHAARHFAAKHGSAMHHNRKNLRAALPTGDVTVGEWLPSTGDTLFARLVSIDGDGFISIDGPGECEIALDAIDDPAELAPHALACRVACTSVRALTVQLRQGASKIIATWEHGRPPDSPITVFSYLTESQIGEITNRADLRVRLVST
jgi:hypothetical protein